MSHCRFEGGNIPSDWNSNRLPTEKCTAPFDKYSSVYVLRDNSGTRAIQRPYRTILVVQDACTTETVSFTNRLSHSVDRPRAFLHVLRATGSAQIPQSPEQSIPVMHALESESILIILQCPGWIVSESVRIPVYWYSYEYLSNGEVDRFLAEIRLKSILTEFAREWPL